MELAGGSLAASPPPPPRERAFPRFSFHGEAIDFARHSHFDNYGCLVGDARAERLPARCSSDPTGRDAEAERSRSPAPERPRVGQVYLFGGPTEAFGSRSRLGCFG